MHSVTRFDKFFPLWRNFESIWQLFEGLFSIWQIWSQIFSVENDQILKNNQAIWSHCIKDLMVYLQAQTLL